MRFLFRLDLSLHTGAEFFFGILIFGTKHGAILWCTNRLRNVLLLLWYQQTGLIANLMLGLIGCTAHTSNTWLTSLLSPPWLSSCTLQIYFIGPLVSLRIHLYFYSFSKMKEHSSLKRKKKLPDQCKPKLLLPIVASYVNCVQEDDNNSLL